MPETKQNMQKSPEGEAKSNIIETDESRRRDVSELISFARECFHSGDFDMTADFCRLAIKKAGNMPDEDLGVDAHYILCLANLKMGRYDAARSVCAEARVRFGDYLDVAYVEMLISAVKGETHDVPRLAGEFMRLCEEGAHHLNSFKTRTRGNIGEVFLIWGQALEQLGDLKTAIEIYEKYLKIHPEDATITSRLTRLTLMS
jgi:tetratricopeptide (TPR) repeat protein